MRLDRLFKPDSIAVYGASENRGPGRRILEMLDMLGYGGAVYPVNPRYETVLGKRCYPGLEEIPESIDAIVFCVNHRLVVEPFRIAADRGYGAAVILDGGFAEVGEEGRGRQDELEAAARGAGMAVCGPNCMGVLSPHHRTSLYTSNLLHPEKLPGNVAIVTQSGSIAIGLLTDCRRFGFSHVVSTGNEVVTTTAEFIEYLADDPDTRVIATFTETIRDPERYVAALDKAADRGKPVVVLKVGRNDRTRRAITSHTGGLAGEARVFSEVLKRHRAIEVGDMDELTEVLACCQGERWPTGPKMGVLTASGGQAELILDVAGAAGLRLLPLSEDGRREAERVIGPLTGDGNPLDAWGDGKFDVNIPHGLKVLEDEPDVDSIVMVSDSRDDSPMVPTQYTQYLAETARRTAKPCFFMNTRPGLFRQEFADALRAAGVPTIGGARQGLGAVDRLARWSTPRPEMLPEPPSTARVASFLANGNRPCSHLNEVDSKRLLREAGLPVVREEVATSREAVLEAARTVGYPVVLKAVSDGIPHKSDLGLVTTGLADEAAAARAFDDMTAALERLSPPPSDAALIVQPMIRDAVEFFMGVSRDPDFGPVLAFGLGGVLVEIFDDVAFRPLPLCDGDVNFMIAETRCRRLLGGVRGQPPRDVQALRECLTALGEFAWAERDSIAEIDLNPVMSLPRGQGCLVVDALIIPREKTT
ncbi:MAG: acetate--CoA ligase family protein [Deltaproteobacteria bacterium]|nr:acetate--CoA ligase family protein [Deltaproteobacteria bacterium]